MEQLRIKANNDNSVHDGSNPLRINVFLTYFVPEIASSMYLPVNLVEGLAEKGNEVNLFLPLPTRGVDDNQREWYKSHKCEIKCNGNLKIYRYWLWREGRNPLARAVRYLVMNIISIYKGLQNPCDVIFVESTPPTQGLMATVLSKFTGIPFVYGLQDVFPDSLVSAGLAKEGGLIWKFGRLIERITYSSSENIITISKDMTENIRRKGVSENKIVTIPNWVEEDVLVPIPRESNKLIDELGLDKRSFYVVYAGSVGYMQDIDSLIEASKLTADDHRIKYLVFGIGPEFERCKERIECEGKGNIQIYPILPYERSAEVYSLADLALVSCKKGLGGKAMPSKTWNILATGTKIIASFDEGELSDTILDNNLGLHVSPEDPQALADAIVYYADSNEEYGKKHLGCRNYVLENISRAKLIDEYDLTLHLAANGKK